jgi:hypothetical protein
MLFVDFLTGTRSECSKGGDTAGGQPVRMIRGPGYPIDNYVSFYILLIDNLEISWVERSVDPEISMIVGQSNQNGQ